MTQQFVSIKEEEMPKREFKSKNGKFRLDIRKMTDTLNMTENTTYFVYLADHLALDDMGFGGTILQAMRACADKLERIARQCRFLNADLNKMINERAAAEERGAIEQETVGNGE